MDKLSIVVYHHMYLHNLSKVSMSLSCTVVPTQMQTIKLGYCQISHCIVCICYSYTLSHTACANITHYSFVLPIVAEGMVYCEEPLENASGDSSV